MFRLMTRRAGVSPLKPQTPLSSRFLSSTPRYPTISRPILSRNPQPSLKIPLQSRSNSTSSYRKFKQSYKEAWSKIWITNPIGFPLSVLFVTSMAGLLGYIIYDRVTRVNPYLNKFPPEVAKPLRKAIHHSEIRPDPIVALQMFREALVIADHVNMHPFSDEVLGIRIAAAEMLEKNSLVKASIDMLEKTLRDCKEWVENGRRRQAIRQKQRENQGPSQQPLDPDAAVAEAEALEKEESEDRLRYQVMKKVIGMRIKLADLYSKNQEMDKAEQSLIGAVNESAGEVRRRRELNLPVSRDDGYTYVNLTEIAASCNELADLYAKQGKNHFAALLYMQSLGLIKEEEGQSTTCAQVVLLNNVSSQMAEEAQKASGAAGATIARTDGPPISRTELLDTASQWAKKALDVAAHIKPPVRNEECDQSCQVALYNLGEIAEMQKNFAEARKYYQESEKLATQLQFEEGKQVASEALKRLESLK
ncbi:hypothetical protein FQN55_008445 [Onygenales sp. PD_40]|nr:hypothetical protein FQN55_008445 [Onygenales sp. PD_40]